LYHLSRLPVTGTFQFLDGGRLDLGVVRDSTLDATNDYAWTQHPTTRSTAWATSIPVPSVSMSVTPGAAGLRRPGRRHDHPRRRHVRL